MNAIVYPEDGTVSQFTVINLGHGRVQMGDSIHDARIPALWFGKEGKGIGHEEVLNREAKDDETIAVVTFANVEGLDVLLDVVQRIRRESFPSAPSSAEAAAPDLLEALRNLLKEGEFTDYPNTRQWFAVNAARDAIEKATGSKS